MHPVLTFFKNFKMFIILTNESFSYNLYNVGSSGGVCMGMEGFWRATQLELDQ